jgi:hypothetical protein
MTRGGASRLRKNDRRRCHSRAQRFVILAAPTFCHSWPQAENPADRASRDFATLNRRAAAPSVTMLQAAMPPVSYGCEVVLRTIRWILATRLTPLRKNDRGMLLTPLRKNDREKVSFLAAGRESSGSRVARLRNSKQTDGSAVRNYVTGGDAACFLRLRSCTAYNSLDSRGYAARMTESQTPQANRSSGRKGVNKLV